eukprot:4761647-Ditylum_brightwellii.AAC.1
MVTLKEKEQASRLRCYWQSFLNLMGSSNSTVELTGKAMNEKEFVFTKFSRVGFVIAKVIACSLFGEYEIGAHLVIEKGSRHKFRLEGAAMKAMMFLFHRALCLYALARQDKMKKR